MFLAHQKQTKKIVEKMVRTRTLLGLAFVGTAISVSTADLNNLKSLPSDKCTAIAVGKKGTKDVRLLFLNYLLLLLLLKYQSVYKSETLYDK